MLQPMEETLLEAEIGFTAKKMHVPGAYESGIRQLRNRRNGFLGPRQASKDIQSTGAGFAEQVKKGSAVFREYPLLQCHMRVGWCSSCHHIKLRSGWGFHHLYACREGVFQFFEVGDD